MSATDLAHDDDDDDDDEDDVTAEAYDFYENKTKQTFIFQIHYIPDCLTVR